MASIETLESLDKPWMIVYNSCVQSFESLDGLVGSESLEPLECLISIAINQNSIQTQKMKPYLQHSKFIDTKFDRRPFVVLFRKYLCRKAEFRTFLKKKKKKKKI